MFYILILLSSLNMSWGAFLSYSETSTTKMKTAKGMNPQMAAMMKAYAPPPTTDKIYVSGGKWAQVGQESTMIIDYDQRVHIDVDHGKKTYTQAPLDDWLDKSPAGDAFTKAQFSAQRKELGKNKKMAGRSCQLVTTKVEVSGVAPDEPKQKKMGPQGGSYQTTTLACEATQSPKAWQEYMAAATKYWKSREKKIKNKFKTYNNTNPWKTGLVLYSETKTKINSGMPREQAAMMPDMTMIDQVSKISEKPFAMTVFQPPKGYRKVQPQY